MKPIFIDASDFHIDHFKRHRILVDCHLNDTDKPWYDHIEETTYRPIMPIADQCPKKSNSFLVYTTYTSDSLGCKLEGYVTFSEANACSHALLNYHPMFWNGKKFLPFWHGCVYQFGRRWLDEAVYNLARLCKTSSRNFFPCIASVDLSLIFGKNVSFKIPSFGYFSDSNNTVVFEPMNNPSPPPRPDPGEQDGHGQ
jgi:hypothetical protein